MENVSRTFSSKPQFGTLEQTYQKFDFEKKREICGVDSLTAQNVDLSRLSKYLKNELLIQTLSVPNRVDKLTCSSVTFK